MSEKRFPRRAIHLDCHTMPAIRDVGADFQPERFADTLSRAHVDYITVFARCNLGMAFYPTKVGTVHPSLDKDMLGPMVEACHARDIQVAAYLNAGIDHEHALHNRGWCKMNAQGQVYRIDHMGHSFRDLCLNTGYGQHLLDMCAEVLDWYPVDGLFLDCFDLRPCYGVECIDGMRELGWDPFDEEKAKDYCYLSHKRFFQKVEELVAAKRPGIKIVYNGLGYRDQPTHLELEILPTSFWGYDYLPWAIRYARTVDRPYFTMTGRFHKGWGDFGGLRPKESLLFDCYNSIANGGTCSIGDHLHPRGYLEPAVYDLIGEVFGETMKLDPWADDAKTLADIAVVEPRLGDCSRQGPDTSSVKGAARMLMELKAQFDVCDARHPLEGYRLLILPDHVTLDDDLKAKVERHLAAGGALITSGVSGLDPEQTGFSLDAIGAVYEGPEPHDPGYFLPKAEIAEGFPDLPLTIYQPGIAMQAKPEATVLAEFHQPYFNYRAWDWRHENMYTPQDCDSGRPALVQKGRCLHFSFPVFLGYFKEAMLPYRKLVGCAIDRVLDQPLVKAENLPSFGQIDVTEQPGRRMVHLLTYVPELRGEALQVVEEPIVISDVTVRLRLDGKTVARAYLAPTQSELPIHVEDGYAVVTVPKVRGYQMVVFEEA